VTTRQFAIVVSLVVLAVAATALISYEISLGQRVALATRADENYVAIAKTTVQGAAYFRRFPNASCSVARGWNVIVNCDYPQQAIPHAYQQKFRVQIDPGTSAVLSIEIQTSAP
jgi:hypothetical protein